MNLKRWFSYGLLGLVLAALGLFLIYRRVENSTAPFLHNSTGSVPETKVAVILGTSRYLTDGGQNLYFKYRMDAAEELFNSGKVEYLLVSGDNRKENYNEPAAMQEALLERGIPKDRIILDYAGFRTFDSMIRAREVFGQSGFIVISQRFHNERAVYIARQNNIEAVGYNARDVEVYAGFKTRVREVLARVKMMLDIYVFNTQPHFLGEKIIIGG